MDFFEFLNNAVTPYHTVDCLRTIFLNAGFTSLQNNEFNKNENNRFFIERGGALISVIFPKKVSENTRFKLAMAHTDFPSLHVSPLPDSVSAQIGILHTEVYGCPLFSSWLSRDLGYAGLLVYKKEGMIQSKCIRGEKLFCIPSLAIHLDRDVNKNGTKINPQIDFNVLWKSTLSSNNNLKDNLFVEYLKKELSPDDELLDFDIHLFDAQKAQKGGINDEWVYSSRIDNLTSCHAILESMVSAQIESNDICMGCFFNNEEIGSITREGAASDFLESTLEYIWELSCSKCKILPSLKKMLSESFALSIDVAHGAHPNHLEKYEPNHSPVLGGGIVLKINSQKRYASDIMSSANLRDICNQIKIPLQTFVSRNDMPCGSTIGPIVSANLGIPTADIGEPILSMHSIREMMAINDHNHMIMLIKKLFFNE